MHPLRWIYLNTAVLLLAFGCSTTIPVRIPPSPAVQVAHEVAVVARTDSCRAAANTLAKQLALRGFNVKYDAQMRVSVELCEGSRQVDVFETDAGREVIVEERMLGLVVVSEGEVVRATIIGEGKEQASQSFFAHNKQIAKRAQEALVADWVQQLAPTGTLVRRRVYPNSNDHTHRLTNRAVQAEKHGDFDEALSLATEAWRQKPTVRNARYVSHLSQLIRSSPTP